jgi:hypothetical protein
MFGNNLMGKESPITMGKAWMEVCCCNQRKTEKATNGYLGIVMGWGLV